MTHPLAPLARALAQRSARYVLIGVSGANLYGPGGQAVFTTDDIDLFLPPDPDNLVHAWSACEEAHLELWLSDEPLDRPRDRGIGPFRLFRPTFVPFCEHRDPVDCAAGDDVQDFLVGTRKGEVVGIP